MATPVLALETLPQWVAWTLKDGRKLPVNPRTGDLAKANDPATWGNRQQAESRCQKIKGAGLGLMLGPVQGLDGVSLGGVDLDSCRDPATGKVDDWAQQVADRLGSYCEVSPSGTGLKLYFLHSESPGYFDGKDGKSFKRDGAGKAHPPAIEIYLGRRWFAFTGEDFDIFADAPAIKPIRRDQLEWLVKEAGPRFAGSKAKDESRSGVAFRMAFDMQWDGKPIEAFAEWAAGNPWGDYESQGDAAIGKTWNKAGNDVEAARQVLIAKFEDLGVDVEARRSTLKGFGLADLADAKGSFEFVQGVMAEDSLSCVYGAPGTGKTFLMLDLALHVASNKPWQGRNVSQSGVLYIALEGAGGFKRRLKAWCMHHGADDDLPFYAMAGSLDIRNDAETVNDIVRTAKAKAAEWGLPVRLIVIDTLARAMAGGDENSAQDMGTVVRVADNIRQAAGANVCLVHHSGKDSSKGARGSNALLGAVDTEIEVNREGNTRKAILTKQKDGEDGVVIPFALDTVKLGYADQWGEPVTSCVVLPGAVASFDPMAGLSDKAKVVLELAREHAKSATETDDDGNSVISRRDLAGQYAVRIRSAKPISKQTRSSQLTRALADLHADGMLLIKGDKIHVSA